MRKLMLLLVLCAFVSGSRAQSLTGKLQLTSGWKPMIYLLQFREWRELMAGSARNVFDSIPISKDGSFHYDLRKIPNGRLIRLNVVPESDDNPGTLIGNFREDNYFFLFASHNDQYTLTGKIGQLFVSGRLTTTNARTRTLHEHLSVRKQLFPVIDSLSSVFKTDPEQLQRAFGAALQENNTAYRKKLVVTRDDYAALISASFYFSGLQRFDADTALFLRLARNVKKKYADDPLSISYRAALADELNFLAIGDTAPDFRCAAPAGDSLQLSQVKGRLILLDFWATWCKPCIAEQEQTIRQLKPLEGQGLQIVSISLDQDRATWLRFLKARNYDWKHGIVNGFDDEVCAAYKVSELPRIYLLDQDLRVVGKNLRGAALTDFVRQYLSRDK